MQGLASRPSLLDDTTDPPVAEQARSSSAGTAALKISAAGARWNAATRIVGVGLSSGPSHRTWT